MKNIKTIGTTVKADDYEDYILNLSEGLGYKEFVVAKDEQGAAKQFKETRTREQYVADVLKQQLDAVYIRGAQVLAAKKASIEAKAAAELKLKKVDKNVIDS